MLGWRPAEVYVEIRMPYCDDVVAAYDALAADWDVTHGGGSAVMREAGDIFAGYVNAGRVLEIGCATGRDTQLLRSLGFECTGVDISPAMVALARAKQPDVAFEVADLYRLPYAKGTFHGFWANAVLLHVPKADMPCALACIRRVLRLAALGFVSVKLGDGEGFVTDSTGHRRFFSFWERMEFLRMLSDAGWLQLAVHERPDPLGRPGVRWLWCFIMAT